MMEDDLTISCSNMKQLGRFCSILRTYTVVLAEGKCQLYTVFFFFFLILMYGNGAQLE